MFLKSGCRETEVALVFSSLLWRISEWNTSGWRTNVGGAWFFSVGNWLDGYGLLLA